MAAAGGGGVGSMGPGPGPRPGTPLGEEAAVAAAPPDRPAAPAGPEPRRKRRRVWGHSPPAGSGWSPSSRSRRRLPLPHSRSVLAPAQPCPGPAASRGTVPSWCPALPSSREPGQGPADPK